MFFFFFFFSTRPVAVDAVYATAIFGFFFFFFFFFLVTQQPGVCINAHTVLHFKFETLINKWCGECLLGCVLSATRL